MAYFTFDIYLDIYFEQKVKEQKFNGHHVLMPKVEVQKHNFLIFQQGIFAFNLLLAQ
jgi:hypothetical protein